MSESPVVVFIQRVVPHYRVDFFRSLRSELGSTGVQMHLYYGQEKPGTVPRSVDLADPGVRRLNNHYLRLPGGEVVWYEPVPFITKPDLLVVEHAARNAGLYWWYLRRGLTRAPRLALWGHGDNFQARGKGGVGAWLRNVPINMADWYFAYTSLSAEIMQARGFPGDRITDVQNTIDTEKLASEMSRIGAERMIALREGLGIKGENVGLFCGGLYREKRLRFLLEAAAEIRAVVSNFELIVIGDGPEAAIVERAAASCSWVHWLGEITGQERAGYFALSSVFLMPGLVGLAIVDAFTAGRPLFTTDITIHSPEIAYLRSGVNGQITPNDVKQYAAAVVNFFRDRSEQERLRDGCRVAAGEITMREMVRRFRTGIVECLGSPMRGRTN